MLFLVGLEAIRSVPCTEAQIGVNTPFGQDGPRCIEHSDGRAVAPIEGSHERPEGRLQRATGGPFAVLHLDCHCVSSGHAVHRRYVPIASYSEA